MYYAEKFEDNKWYKRHSPKGKWYEFNAVAYKNKAIELQKKQVEKSDLLQIVSNCSHEWKSETFDNMGFCLTEYCELCGATRDTGW